MQVHSALVDLFAWNFIQTVNILPDGEDGEGWPTNCCPVCCGPCSALNSVLSNSRRVVELQDLLRDTGYPQSGWRFWDADMDLLDIKAIKAKWFKADGTHKAICVSENGVDKSAELHEAAKLADETPDMSQHFR